MSIYINLPVSDLTAATTFYTAIWFTQNMQFSNDDASGMERNEHIRLMLLTHDFTQWFLPAHKQIADSKKLTEVLNALDFDSKDAVDQFVSKALNAGATLTKEYDHWFMYGKDFEDLDGHIWEAFWMQEQE